MKSYNLSDEKYMGQSVMGKINGSRSIVVNAPINIVFDKFNDLEIRNEWFSHPIEIRNYTPPLEAGKTYETITKFMGQEISNTSTITVVDAPNLVEIKSGGMFSGNVQHICEKVDGGTKVTIVFDGETSGFLAGLAAPLLRGQIDKRMKADLDSFKKYIEN